MSELKATTVYNAYWKANSVGEGTGIQVYLKSEADKVIAELKKACNDKDDWCLQTLKELRHSNYKRCLAMARWCRTSARCDEGLGAFRYRDWYWKWFKRWLELAQRFKEAK